MPFGAFGAKWYLTGKKFQTQTVPSFIANYSLKLADITELISPAYFIAY